MALKESIIMGASLDTDFRDHYGLQTEHYRSGGGADRRQIPISQDGILKDFYIDLTWAMITDVRVSVNVNGAASALDLIIPAGQTFAESLNQVPVVAGDYVHLQCWNLCASRKAAWNLIYQYGPEKFSLITANAYGGIATTRYWALNQNTDSTAYVAESEVRCLCPRAMTFKTLRLKQFNGAGHAAATWTVTLVKNGVDTALTATGTQNGTAYSAAEVAVAPWDRLCWKVVTVGNTSSSIIGLSTMAFPTVPADVEQVMCTGSARAQTVNNLVRYGYLWPSSPSSVWSATPHAQQLTCKSKMSVHDFYLEFDVAPGLGKSYEFRLQKNDIDTALAVTIADNNVQGSDLSHVVEVDKGDKLGLKVTPTGLPALVYPIWGMVFSRKHIGNLVNSNAKMRMLAKV